MSASSTDFEGCVQQQRLVRDGDPYSMALTAWSLVHGLVMLVLDGQLSGKSPPSAEQLTLSATELLMFGMAPTVQVAKQKNNLDAGA